MSEEITHCGGCHCGEFRFEAKAPKDYEAIYCNCSICAKKGILHLIVTKDKFKIIKGQEVLSLYTFNTGVAKHYFCSKCGICPYYIPRSHPNDIDVNARCIDNFDIKKVKISEFDGQNWEDTVHTIQS